MSAPPAVFHRGRVHTLDPATPQVEALAVEGGRIVATGSSDDLLAAFPRHARVDLVGRAAFPAFCDCHIHLASYGLSLRRLVLDGVPTLAQAVLLVAEAVRAAGDGWVAGRGWNKNLWPEERLPTAADLDPISPHTPVVLHSKDGHVIWVNSEALRRAGVTAATPDPEGGEIVRDERGRPVGVLRENAAALVTVVVPPPPDGAWDAAVDAAMAEMYRRGIVAVHDVEGAAALRAFQRRLRRGGRPVRVRFYLPSSMLDAAAAVGIETGLGDERLRVGGVKIFSDGALGGQTAWMLEPYEGLPGHTGIAAHSPGELRDLIRRAVEAHLACAIHAIGDRANREVLDALEAVVAHSRAHGLRHRIEHVQLLHPDDVPRLSALGVVASMQPIHATSDREIADRYWGERARHGYAWRSVVESGAALAFGSDAPVETPDVVAGLYAAVTRRRAGDPRPSWYPGEAISIEEAVRAYTLGAAYAAGEERERGTLGVGKAADFVVLSEDLFTIEPEAIPSVQVVLTVSEGEVVYASSGSSSNAAAMA